ncbi:hypothetical protein Bpfe_000914 [Biomphalaria pfeifferi]|uniref:Secreted protein n=1 Tax=Biomphalaria pfeifferi TaxID=112525 RepID=A0AAD8FLU4_BIOPF|nr:hypothetical protein Bpfe_000914 [Biomphalaria pfeifferi]
MDKVHIVLLLVSSNVYLALAQFNPNQQQFGSPPFDDSPPFSPFGPGTGSPMFPGSQTGFGSPFGGQGYNPLFGGQRFPQVPFQPPQVLTCIGVNEALDQVKITLRPEPNGNYLGQNQAFQFGQPRELQRQDWRLSAVYIPAGSTGAVSPAGTNSLIGQFFLAITRYGRTDGHCAGLGGILQNDDLINQGQQSRTPQYSQFGNGMFGQSSFPAGFIQDPIVISQGGNVYSGVIRSLSEADLRGRGVAICLDYLCQRPTTTCCSIVKDSAPATEMVGAPTYVGPVSGSLINNKGTTSTGTGTGSGTGIASSTGTGGFGGLF